LITHKQFFAWALLRDCKVTEIKFCNKPELLYFQSIRKYLKVLTTFSKA
jgi:hypothetical protein